MFTCLCKDYFLDSLIKLQVFISEEKSYFTFFLDQKDIVFERYSSELLQHLYTNSALGVFVDGQVFINTRSMLTDAIQHDLWTWTVLLMFFHIENLIDRSPV